MRPTGTIRRDRFDAITASWVICEHRCRGDWIKREVTVNGYKLEFIEPHIFTHKIDETQAVCHIKWIWSHMPCAKCMEYPDWLKGKAKLGVLANE